MVDDYKQDLKLGNRLLFWETGKPQLDIGDKLILRNKKQYILWEKIVKEHIKKYETKLNKIRDEYNKERRRLGITKNDIIKTDGLWNTPRFGGKFTKILIEEDKEFNKLLTKFIKGLK